MIWDSIRGHANQVEMFRRAIRRQRMSHAYLFCGQEGIGKRRFANTLAQCLFCTHFPDEELDACGDCPSCRQMTAGTHPDFLSIACPEGKTEFPIDLIAGAKPNRGREGLCYDISLRPIAGNRRIAVLDDVDMMNAESANAFLKTLEEPPDYATLILLSANPDSLLPTIRSRCQFVRFFPLAEKDVADLLLGQECVESRDEANALAAICHGSLSVAAQLTDPKMRELQGRIHSTLSGGDFHSTQIADEVTKALEALGDTNAQRRGAVWIMRFCIEFYRQALCALAPGATAGSSSSVSSGPQFKPGTAGQASSGTHEPGTAGQAGSGTRAVFLSHLRGELPESLELLGDLIERAAVAIRQVERMSPVSLCLQGLFADLSQLSRRLPTG